MRGPSGDADSRTAAAAAAAAAAPSARADLEAQGGVSRLARGGVDVEALVLEVAAADHHVVHVLHSRRRNGTAETTRRGTRSHTLCWRLLVFTLPASCPRAARVQGANRGDSRRGRGGTGTRCETHRFDKLNRHQCVRCRATRTERSRFGKPPPKRGMLRAVTDCIAVCRRRWRRGRVPSDRCMVNCIESMRSAPHRNGGYQAGIAARFACAPNKRAHIARAHAHARTCTPHPHTRSPPRRGSAWTPGGSRACRRDATPSATAALNPVPAVGATPAQGRDDAPESTPVTAGYGEAGGGRLDRSV